ncbi:hypothetical protein [Candidatus Viridilinea mediisalina]|uniref:Alpha-L-rhamnosidase six-hairpin glycosidase domain-containing protein n=1 Tax=Candidatus Viridilinea mediisalina TaxID=2024553 RepID=A0A2A6RK10_9CHLR|nr:hypothetical protein [Candidatus Viridilinea mediisalina]PDW03283.1 hypothetical protein CJ255_09560 [Candidatus Viridilinea mediisalina]
MPRLPLLIVLLLIALALPMLPRERVQAQGLASFSSSSAVVAPLDPTVVNVNITGYSGPATLLVFDPRSRLVGSFPFNLVGGYGAVEVLPRGTLGNHWAALFLADGRQVANGTIYRLEAQTTVQTGVPAFDQLYGQVRDFMASKRLSYELDGRTVAGYRSPDSPLLWLRDHYYQNRAFRYFEGDLVSLIEANQRAQRPDGSLPDFVARPEFGIPALRTPVEADVEYLYVQLIYETWQTTGDTAWMLRLLPSAQRAINYTLTSPERWQPDLGLVMRPFTIDTWDFAYGPTTRDPNTGQPAPRHWIDEHTKWGIFHGDNTGLAEALRSLAVMEAAAGHAELAAQRRGLANDIMVRLNRLSWNGNFFTHHVKLVPYQVPGVDEARQLSLSNAIALNRGVLSLTQGRAILAEYQRRLNDPGRTAFAEWFSIDPPFPPGAFGLDGRLGERPGEYVNGGIMPLVGGELSRGAFRHGYESYGFDILYRYDELIRRTGSTFLWYYPTGGVAEVDHFLPTDGWGSSAMLGALIEGAAGIENRGLKFSEATLSPRWLAAPRNTIQHAYAVARYAASDGYAAYRWQHQPAANRGAEGHIQLEATSSGETFLLRVLLPPQAERVTRVVINGQPAPLRIETLGFSRYALVEAAGPIVNVQVTYR